MELVTTALILLRVFFFHSIADERELPVSIDRMVVEIDLAKHQMTVSVPQITLLTDDAEERTETIACLKQNLTNGPVPDSPADFGLVLKKCKLKSKKKSLSASMQVNFLDNVKLLKIMGIVDKDNNYCIYPESGESVLDGNGLPLGDSGEGYCWPKSKKQLRMTFQFSPE